MVVRDDFVNGTKDDDDDHAITLQATLPLRVMNDAAAIMMIKDETPCRWCMLC